MIGQKTTVKREHQKRVLFSKAIYEKVEKTSNRDTKDWKSRS